MSKSNTLGNIHDYLRKLNVRDGVLYYPGSGTDAQPFHLFAEGAKFSKIIYSDYGIAQDEAERFITSLNGWTVKSRAVVGPEYLGENSWLAFWTDEYESQRFEKPGTAYALRATLVNRTREGEALEFMFLRTEAIQTLAVLAHAGIRPNAIVIQDHGCGGNWASFGANSELNKMASKERSLPQLLLVPEGGATEPWPGYRRVTDYSEPSGGMHNYRRAIFQRNDAKP